MMQKTKILIADDENEVLATMAKRIKAEGYDVFTASNGEEAWDSIKRDDPDVIILDLIMPKLDGLAVLKELRNNPPSKKWQPVIIISALNELDDFKKGYAHKADHYLVKPCSMEDILKAIRLMLSLIPQRKPQDQAPPDSAED